ncbi:uncharacterized protein B0I36DRAFT_346612 [Microdochium trichocladiopsis]|uniref:non-specific serine/threonine protein kinase n=1 Tax=Microdochium trichocladiopsis TaxID=1682393 RepID=A0A9P8YAJ4_9PEZI|nr:uncharacterized protein B0I36DRAFT_346612 [Microdochium trichocladiopsis]KAH7034717.1 hypothetical protein B0I36DRAFT_346612 [Microdochium trichocladiopsis]
MSSAALQPVTHQSAPLPGLNASSQSLDPRQYTPAQSPGRDGHYWNRDNTNASPATSRHATRRPSGSNAEPIQTSPMASRTAVAAPVGMTASSDHEKSSRRRHEPPIAPPRTSSTQQGSTTGNSRRAARAEERERERVAQSPRHTPGDSSRNGTNGTESASRMGGDETTPRSRRAVSQHAPEPQWQTSHKDHRQTMTTTMPIRTNPGTSTSSSSKQPSREASEVLNRMIVSQPEVDIERERERLDEAIPHPVGSKHDPRDTDVDDAIPPPIARQEDDGRRGHKSRQDHSKREKATKFGDYYLGNTIGEGEFGKVKLGWKQDGGVQVAIKLIRRDTVGNNPSRLAKIYREIAILRDISHPNIVRLHEMSETERHIGIVLEYASGGELFDYILNHRYLKDNPARRLFAQLVSGVGYLHKKGIVHRDLKLENLLLDRNRNIIITDFGFANTFDPNDELTEDEELQLGDRDFVKRSGLDRTKANGMRRGDLMQTSCGSPCYAAPELVVSDSLYTGRKVDVWSCGVILYAMLAGYLPFDDDPANPEGDNINLLYKYIVNTPLTFPEYVTPHARDLLRRILVPQPRKRADLFEVARHSWLSEYAHVVEFITSATTTTNEIQNTTVPAEDGTSGLGRSASVRDAPKTKPAPTNPGDLGRKQAKIEGEESGPSKTSRDNKRRTVQVEYVAPSTSTQRGSDASPVQSSPQANQRPGSSSHGPKYASPEDKPLPRDPPLPKQTYASSPSYRKPPTSYRDPTQSAHIDPSGRPTTGGSSHSAGHRVLGASARNSYAQPLPPTFADTNAQGSIQQPTSASQYPMASPTLQDQADSDFGRPSAVPTKFAQVSGFDQPQKPSSHEGKGHRRSNTLGELGDKIFGRRGSLFGGRKKRPEQQQAEKASRKYPPVSMSNTVPGNPRESLDSRASRRSFSLGLNKKPSGSVSGSQTSQERPQQTRRFSLIKAMGLSKEPQTPPPVDYSQSDLPIQEPAGNDEYSQFPEPPQSQGNMSSRHRNDSDFDVRDQRLGSAPHISQAADYGQQQRSAPGPPMTAVPPYMQQDAVLNSGSESSFDQSQRRRQYQPNYDSDQYDRPGSRNVLQKNKRFVDAYNDDDAGRRHDHSGSSGPAKKVMDFFRRRRQQKEV